MNRKAETEETTRSNLFYLIPAIAIFLSLLFFLRGQMNGAAHWGEYYAKGVSLLIESSSPGDEIRLDIDTATKIAKSNGVPFQDVFSFDNQENRVCVKLEAGQRTCYNYFNNVNVVSQDLQLGVGEEGTNILIFKVVEKKDEQKIAN